MKLLYFNPETEYALASGASFYTPPARVEKLKHENELLPELWANDEDMILVDDMAGLKSVNRLVTWGDLREIFAKDSNLIFEPWGWNPALVRKLKDYGVPEQRLPKEVVVRRIRELAHRRTTISLTTEWNEAVDDRYRIDVPVELSNIDACIDFYRNNIGCWMKAPWSSSGRGVINTAADMTEKLVEQWCRGILRRQGSVMGETAADRMEDYATEWRMKDGVAEFLGLSSFSTSNRGKYISNHIMNQRDMADKFNSESELPLFLIADLQKTILQRVLEGYEGLFGVDMIVECNGKLRPFVEVNLRRTMGMLHIKP
ncbi:MAG: hypothetical protein K2I08_07470 [Muribaculaceae bacterium]|nr:hypothetical protein [Muribaculaceae bacterium]